MAFAAEAGGRVAWLAAVLCLVAGCSLDRRGQSSVDPLVPDLGAIDVGLDARPRDTGTRPDAAGDARDAFVDAQDAERDAEIDAEMDAGRDADPEDAGVEDVGVEDAGEEPDAAPFCPSDCECIQSCSFGPCDCSGGCACALSCNAGCSGKCDGAGTICTLDASAVGVFSFGCDHGATCTFRAAASGAADFDCRHESSCDVTCTATGPCTVRCREGSQCVVRCALGLCSLTDCPAEDFTDCGFGVQVCNRPCP